MTDIVERLSREAATPESPADEALFRDAIAEIMRLRHIIEQHSAAMKLAIDAPLQTNPQPGQSFADIREQMRNQNPSNFKV